MNENQCTMEVIFKNGYKLVMPILGDVNEIKRQINDGGEVSWLTFPQRTPDGKDGFTMIFTSELLSLNVFDGKFEMPKSSNIAIARPTDPFTGRGTGR